MGIVISNKIKLGNKIEKFKLGSNESLHILSDFDRTLTKAFVNGKKIPSVISILRDEGHLTPDYSERAHALFDNYHPIEINLNISLEEKKEAMREWWAKHFELLIESRLNKKDIEEISKSDKIQLRLGIKEFMELLKTFQISLVISCSAKSSCEASTKSFNPCSSAYPMSFTAMTLFLSNLGDEAEDQLSYKH